MYYHCTIYSKPSCRSQRIIALSSHLHWWSRCGAVPHPRATALVEVKDLAWLRASEEGTPPVGKPLICGGNFGLVAVDFLALLEKGLVRLRVAKERAGELDFTKRARAPRGAAHDR